MRAKNRKNKKRAGRRAIKRAEGSNREQFLRLEEARQLELGVLVAIRGVDDVLHHLGAEIAANRALGGLAGVRGPEQVAHLLDDVVAFQRHHDDRAGAHESLDLRVERLVRHVGVVLAELGGRQLAQLAPHDRETGGLKAIKHVTDMALGHAVRLKDDECSLHISRPPYFWRLVWKALI